MKAIVLVGSGTEAKPTAVSHIGVEVYCVPNYGEIYQKYSDMVKGQPAVTMVYQLDSQSATTKKASQQTK